jgi:hypothetical protein
MIESKRYRNNAAECLSAAQEGRDSYYCQLNLSLAASWISLARQDEATAVLLASWSVDDAAKGTRQIAA